MAGANINISSKELVGYGEINAGVSGGFNTQSLSSDFLKLDGVNAFGFADSKQPGDNLDVDAYNFQNRLDPSKKSGLVNQSYSISGGKKFDINDNPLSFYLIGSHNRDYSYYEEEVRNSITTGELSQDMLGKKSNVETSQVVMANQT